LSKGVANPEELQGMNALLRRLERFWSQSMDYSVRPTGAIDNAA